MVILWTKNHLSATPFQGCSLLLAVLHAVHNYHRSDASSSQVREVVQQSFAEGQVVAPGGGCRMIVEFDIREDIDFEEKKKSIRYYAMSIMAEGEVLRVPPGGG